MTVTLSTTAETPLAGTPPCPVTWKLRTPCGPGCPVAVPLPSHWLAPTPGPAARVSQIRAGERGL